MAAPNIVNVSTIYGKTSAAVVGATAAALVTNSSGSGKVIKLNSLLAANVTGASATITVDVYKNQSTAYRIAFSVVVPANSTLVVFSKDTSLYLEENDSLRVTGGTASAIEAVCSYDEIS